MYRLNCVVILGALAGLTAHAQSLPPGNGKADFQRICSVCHSVDRATSQRMSRAEWTAVVSDMVGRGAQGSTADLDNVVSYLSANFGNGNPSPSPSTVPLSASGEQTSPSAPPPSAPKPAPQEAPLSEEEISKGQKLIEGNGCLTCHRVGETGSYLGPFLDNVGAHRSAEQLHAALVSPKKDVLPEDRTVRLVTNDGRTMTGRLLNQDAFSVQFIEASGQLRSVARQGLRDFTIVTTNPMPSYADKLSAQDLTDLVRYLSSMKGVVTP
jgi:putative heme-binding domain-containing protein